MKVIWFSGGMVLMALGVVGILLPVMPGTVFLILAAACFAKSSPRFESYILNHPRFGHPVRAFRQTGAIPIRAKLAACSAMGISLAVVAITGVTTAVLLVTAALMAAAAGYILTRPS